MQGPSSHFFPFLARGTKAADERSLGDVALLLLVVPPQGCKAPHLHFALSPSGNKSKGRRAKPGCCSFFTPLNNEDRRQSAPLTETLYCTSTRRASSRYAGETGKRNLCFAVCFALVWPHRRGIGGQGVETRLCIHGACALWTSVDL